MGADKSRLAAITLDAEEGLEHGGSGRGGAPPRSPRARGGGGGGELP
jgi:hypothetical protein